MPFSLSKNLVEFRRTAAKKMQIRFSEDMCLRKTLLRPQAWALSASGGQSLRRSGLQKIVGKGGAFFDGLHGAPASEEAGAPLYIFTAGQHKYFLWTADRFFDIIMI
ncbi:MAG: hypothetical protein PUB51_01660 [Oscillospiraceae bacterium]|nr:hypothetical protein [Oscillospiraceae bacterium]